MSIKQFSSALRHDLADRCICAIVIVVVVVAMAWIVNTLMFTGSFG